MEEVGAQVVPPIFIHQRLQAMPKKRDLPYQTPNFPIDNWNPKVWDWDTVRFVAKPLDSDPLRLSSTSTSTVDHTKTEEPPGPPPPPVTFKKKPSATAAADEDDATLRLNLGGFDDSATRPNKRVRSGSPGSTAYPMCQVDNCKEDLSSAKDYHRRHKVCELHSKSTKALVANQMQRFCQQCSSGKSQLSRFAASRFHPLSEFDEGKRSCRRRLAGHNRRRRKTQPDDVGSRLMLPGDNRDNRTNAHLDIFNLLATVARVQGGKNDDKNMSCSSLPDKEQLLQILSKINSLPLPVDLAAKLHNLVTLNRKISEQTSSDHHDKLNGRASPSTMDLLAALTATLAPSPPDAIATLSQRSSHSSDSGSGKTKLNCYDQPNAPASHKRLPQDFPSVGGDRSSTSYQSPMEDSDCQVQETRVNLPLQLFSSSPENDSPPKLASSRKYFSSDSSNPIDERSPSASPPVVQKLFPMQTMAETVKSEKRSASREIDVNVDSSRINGCNMPFDLFRGSNKATDAGSIQSVPYQAGYTSSGSDHSPSSLNSDVQDRTGRILFKLFDKDPSHFPGTLRAQIFNWLSNSPSEMESYIRPGCVILSVYVSMPSASWEQLQENLLQHLSSLVQSSASDFWRDGRFLVHTGRQLASHKDGKFRLCKSWRTWTSPELISVTPLAVEGGQETSLKLRGRNLNNLGTKIHCTYMGGYTTKEVRGSTYHGTMYEEINLCDFKIHDASRGVLGRCFIEVENGLKGNSFPVIIADASICKELRVFESVFDGKERVRDIIAEDQSHDDGRPRSKEEVLHFLNELGWLFQRKRTSSFLDGPNYSLGRFKFLLTFSVERNCSALMKTLLDILVERNSVGDELSREAVEMLSDIQLLHRAVKRRCRKMVDLLINYSVFGSNDVSKKYIFPPNHVGPGYITPLHLAACMSASDDLIDALTNDPQEIGLNSWNSLLDANGQTPHAYALMTNNQSYIKLVSRKLGDRINGQITLTVGNGMSTEFKQGRSSCAKCAVAATKYYRRVPGAQGLLQRPYVHSMLAIAAVCVCVCLFLRSVPDIGSVDPFKWENLDYGTI
ncbi:SBP-box transcription factor [Trema orientale]|uniref:SBP-box transcription factor n=1 Tax=Trema orientale TaxID=63057 RepID=A0A2P5DIW9_TREOI|nr:SBP-box transcription factor [Trema orientale]